MIVALYTHPASRRHHMPQGHAESVARIEAVESALAGAKSLVRIDCPEAAQDDLLRCHPKSYLEWLDTVSPQQGFAALDPDTYMSPGTLEAASRAVGGNCAAVDLVLSGEVSSAFVATRPPGHHAEPETPMGFCLFGNIAIAALRALDVHGLSRIAVVDFDVHHGNGTQALLWNEDRVRFVSTHQMPLWPGSGAPGEVGAHGQIQNVPLPPGTGGAAYRKIFERDILPGLHDYEPELVLVSAGFDAHTRDPLANLDLETDDFAWTTARLCELARDHADNRLVSTLEGGYDLTALAASTAAHVRVLQEFAP